MNSHTLTLHNTLQVPSPVRRRNQPLLDALEHAQYGRLNLITPDGKKCEFMGEYPGPSAHLKLYDWRALDHLIARGEMGFAETYIKGLWGSENLPELLTYGLMNSPALETFFHGKPWYALFSYIRTLFNGNTPWRSRRNVMAHYDLGNDFYSLWLDKSMTYSCGLFNGQASRTLEEAQATKYRRVLDKLHARPGEHILEIGCGWGGFAEAAARDGIRVTAITLSEDQARYAVDRLHREELDELASIRLIDYRKISGQFDHIVSIGMFEHVGERYWRTYFETIKKCLKPGGTAMIQSITLDDYLFETLHGYTGFMEQVIFPGGMLPSKLRFRTAAVKAGLECQEIFTFGKDYVITLQHWLNRFNAHKDEVRAMGYDEAFLRLWRFYLSACIAAFASGRTDVMQARITHA